MNRQPETLAPDLNEVRVRPHKRSAANLKRLACFLDVTRESERSEGSAFDALPRVAATLNIACSPVADVACVMNREHYSS